MEDPLRFEKQEDVDHDALKNSGSEEDDIGYHSIGRNIKVMALLIALERNFLSNLQYGPGISSIEYSCI